MRIILIALLVMVAQSSFAQNNKRYYIIEGRITNHANKAVRGARLDVLQSNEKFKVDRDGSYFIRIPEGSYLIHFSAEDYLSQEVSISLQKDTILNIVLTSAYGGLTLDDVSITGNSSDKVNNRSLGLSIMSGEMIEKMPSLLGEKDVMRSLQLLPGVTSSSEGNTEMNVRGGSSDQNLILLDHVPLYSSSHLFGMYSAFNPLIVKEASFYTGAFPAAYGGKISSVTDVTTKTASMTTFKGSAELGITSTKAMVEIPLIKNKSSLLLAGRRSFLDVLMGFDKTGEVEYLNFYDFNAIWAHRYSDKSSFKLSAYQEGDQFKSVNYNQKSNEEGLGKKQQAVSLTWNNYASQKIDNEVSIRFNHYKNKVFEEKKQPSSGAPYKHLFTSQVKDISVHYHLGYKPASFLKINVGVEFTNHNLKPAHFSGMEEGELFSIYSLPNSRINEFSSFAAFKFQGKKRELDLALRNNNFYADAKTYSSIEPRISFYQKIGEGLSLKASYSRMTQPLQRLVNPGLGMPLDILYPSDDLIKPQTADIFSAGFSKDIMLGGERFTFSAEGYIKQLKNIISLKDGYDTRSIIHQFDGGGAFKASSVHDMLATGSGKSYGVDFMLEKKQGALSGWLSYSWMKARNRFDEFNGGLDFRAMEDRPHVFNAVVNWAINDEWSFSATWMFSSGRTVNIPESVFEGVDPTLAGALGKNESYLYAYGERNGHRMKSFHKLDIGLTKKISLWDLDSDFNFGLYNVYNRSNPSLYFLGKKFDHTTERYMPKLKAVSLFPIMPAISIKVNF